MKKIFALNLLLISAAAQAQQMPYFAINNPDNNGTGNTAALFSLNSTSTAFLHGSREWPTPECQNQQRDCHLYSGQQF
ncbi:Uncharacterised protein [Enterobacter cloacae]|uniref:Curli production assembly/transport component CsgF n=1 Tax=Enterobacter cloacae TaxID=550 RepID=A0A377LQR8_ENTCL|nr:Uncharacterised protein [Enterobacter cloacae]